MVKIKCPICKSEIILDEDNYSEIVSQVRNDEFKKDLQQRIQEVLKNAENEKKIAILSEKNENEKKIDELKKEISELKLKLEHSNEGLEDKIKLALAEKEKEIIRLKADIKDKESTAKQEIITLKNQHAIVLRDKDDQIAHLKEYKVSFTNKLVGEELEQHCLKVFNQIRMAAYPNSVFEKDNKVSDEGTKGDFIFRDYIDGVEYISIMFEMKNETINSINRHKNEDFFKKLDKDRKEKKCEYAVLVTTLEPENEMYNGGVFDASYAYEKMYVIRPQSFLSIISILCQSAKNVIQTKKELISLQEQNVDITNFENKLFDFKDRFTKSVGDAKKKFTLAIEQIDASIKSLQKVKDNLLGSIEKLEKADDISNEITIKKLTYNNKTMKKLFEEIKKDN